ncbi:MAG: MFS transporter [Chloroflexi bacterium]|nr:MFS transporter [Chloroflexota bacterium]
MRIANTAAGGSGLRLIDALRSNGFRQLWYASWAWYHARWMETMVLGWAVLVLTDSPWLVSLVGFFRMASMPVLGMVAGIVADRLDRRRVAIAAQVVNVLSLSALLALTAAGVAEFWHIAMVTLAMGVAWTFDFPARRSVITDLVGAPRVANAMSLDMAAMNGAKMIGPIVGGVLLTATGLPGAIGALLALYLVGFVFLVKTKFPPRQARPASEPVPAMLSQGFRFVARNQALVGVMLVTIVANMFLFPFVLMVPVFAKDVLHVGPALMGVLAAADGLGSLLGAMYLASRGNAGNPGRVFLFGTSIAMAMVLAFALSPYYSLSLLILFLEGLAVASFGTMQSTIVLLATPPEMRGRIMGVLMMAIGAGPVGTLLTGAMAEAWGAPRAIAIDAIAALALMGVVFFLAPVLRRAKA